LSFRVPKSFLERRLARCASEFFAAAGSRRVGTGQGVPIGGLHLSPSWLEAAGEWVEESEFFERKRLGVWLSDW
jgi:hypothetical protein